MGWRYIEPCCGSASVALALLGARRAILPYQGSKWRFRHAIIDQMAKAGFKGHPSRVELYDIGPWGVVAGCVANGETRAAIVDQLEMMARVDPREVYDALHKHPVPQDPAVYSAQYLFLQRLAFSGKAVGDANGVWASPGFNVSSAMGVAGTDRFGEVKPMVPSLIRVLKGYSELVQTEGVHGDRRAAPAPTIGQVAQPTLVYIDPPYAQGTGYPSGDLDRAGVVSLATAWSSAGATVCVSEGGAVGELVALGWKTKRIYAGRKATSRFRGKQEEWLTMSNSVKQV